MKSGGFGIALLTTVAGAYVVRRLGRGWGATDRERQESLPGDEVVSHPTVQVTHAITIRAPTTAVWPWLIQMGYGRAGWYTNVWWYRLIDRYVWHVNMPRVERILPEFQQLALGDVIPDGPPGAAYWTVAGLDPERSLALYSITHGTVWLPRVLRNNPQLGIHGELAWAFVLRASEPEQTRLILRTRASGGPALYNMLAAVALPPSDFIMARLLLRTIKRNVERQSTAQASAVGAARHTRLPETAGEKNPC